LAEKQVSVKRNKGRQKVYPPGEAENLESVQKISSLLLTNNTSKAGDLGEAQQTPPEQLL
jgi:hypothetical protein